jgi:hypothetical protein
MTRLLRKGYYIFKKQKKVMWSSLELWEVEFPCGFGRHSRFLILWKRIRKPRGSGDVGVYSLTKRSPRR